MENEDDLDEVLKALEEADKLHACMHGDLFQLDFLLYYISLGIEEKPLEPSLEKFEHDALARVEIYVQ